MLAFRRVVDDPATGACLEDGSLNRRRSEILELQIGERLPQFALGFVRRGKRHHGYVLIPTHPIVDGMFGQKPREWNSREKLLEIRTAREMVLNDKLAALGYDVRVDHRSNEERGIEAAPVAHIGKLRKRIEERARQAF